MPLSLAEEAGQVVGIDPINRFGDAGVRLARERALRHLHFALADGMALPFSNGAFDLVLSHAVIEHVADAPLYLRECASVLAPDGRIYLSTAPYLVVRGRASAAAEDSGAAAPAVRPADRLRDLHVPRAPRRVDAEGAGERELVHQAGAQGPDQARRPAREGHGVAGLRAQIAAAGLRIVREELHVTATIRRLPAAVGDRAITEQSARADIFISNMEYVLARQQRVGSTPERERMPVPDVDRYRADDRRAVEALYRRVFGTDAADASRLRWEWQYRRNPNNPGGEPEIWIAREGPAIVGQYATMPVRLAVKGREVTGSWGMDVMVAPERQRRGLGEVLFRTWDRNVGASLGPRAVRRVLPAVPEAAAGRTSARCRAW